MMQKHPCCTHTSSEVRQQLCCQLPHACNLVCSSALEQVYSTACALTVHAIGRYSPDVLKNQAKHILPLAFLGMHEVSEEEKGEREDDNLWTEVWQENVPGKLNWVVSSSILALGNTKAINAVLIGKPKQNENKT